MLTTRLLFNIRKNFHVSQLRGIILFSILGILDIIMLLHISSISMYCNLLCSTSFICCFYFWMQFRLIKRNVENKGYTLISDDSKRRYSQLIKCYGYILSVFLMLPIFLLLLHYISVIDVVTIQLLIIFMLIVITVIKVYDIDMIIAFSDYDFYLGNTKYSYSQISKLMIVKELSSPFSESIIGFEIYQNDQYLGFDKIRYTDYIYLKDKLNLL